MDNPLIKKTTGGQDLSDLSGPKSSIKKKEKRWLLAYAAIVVLITTIPYGLGFLNQGDNHVFTGFVFGVNDGNSYIAKMLIGTAGNWLFRTPYTSLTQDGVLVFFPYIALGKLAVSSTPHTQLVLLFHMFRAAAGILVIIATYDFVSMFLQDIWARRVGLILITIGGGLGWMLTVLGLDQWLGSLPLEFYSPESFGFLGIYGLPHLSLSRAFLLWGFVTLLRTSTPLTTGFENVEIVGSSQMKKPRLGDKYIIRQGLLLGILWIGVWLAQPINLALAWLLTAAYLTGRLVLFRINKYRILGRVGPEFRTALGIAIVGGIVSSPFLIYTGIKYLTDPFLRIWGEQNLLPSPHPAHYLVAYGLVLPFVIVGMAAGLKRIPDRAMLPFLWAVVFPFLAYAPITIQRRLPEGVWVAVVTLAVLGIVYLMEKRAGFRKLGNLLVALSLPAAGLLVLGGVLAINSPDEPIYRPLDEVKIFQTLTKEARTGALVLSSFETGNALPAWAPGRVVIGHGPESVNFEARLRDVTEFFSSATTDVRRLEIIDKLEIEYIFWGPRERNLGKWDPVEADYLNLIAREGEYTLFSIESN